MEISSHKMQSRSGKSTSNSMFSMPITNSPWSSPFSHQQHQQMGPTGGSSMNNMQEHWRQKVGHLKKFFGDEYSPRQPQHFHTSNQHFHTSNQYKQYGQQNLSTTRNIQTYQQSYSAMLNCALQKSVLQDRCEEVSRILPQMSVTELREIYPQLLHNIFGYEANPGWGLHYLEPKMHSYDFNAMINFLSPNGSVFNVIDRLMTDNDAMFHLPFNALPSGVKEAISKNQIPPWYQSKIIAQPGKSVIISMNALEYYFATFSYFVVHPKVLQLHNDWSGIEDVLYVRLFEDYLTEYLPYDGIKFQAISPTSSQAPSTKQQYQSTLLKSSLWRSPEMRFSSQNHHPSIHLEQLQHLPSKAETFLQISTDFWLAFNSEEYIRQEENYKLPSIDHARMVRILIKYLHTFNNATKRNVVQTFGEYTTQFEMDDYQNVVIPMILHNKLYCYLNHCFNHWPLDGTFRMVLETWLSFLQPWRYQNVNTSIDDCTEDVSKWKKFICNNLHFYSNLFSTFLLRALKHDLMSLEDVQLVYRVCKVMSQNSLKEILHEKMGELSPDFNKSAFQQNVFNNTVLNPSLNRKLPDSPIIGNQSLFSPDTIRHVQELCQVLSSTLVGVRHKIFVAIDKKKNKNASSWLAYLRDIFMMDDDVNYEQKRNDQRLIEYLEQSSKLLVDFFKLPELPTDDLARSGDEVELLRGVPGIPRPNLQRFGDDDDALPEHLMQEDGIKLTDRGRYQIIQGLRKFQLVYNGDLELQPIRSYECPAAVRVLYRISNVLNTKYYHTLEETYNRQDIVGNVLRKISSKGLHSRHYTGLSIKLPDSRIKTAAQVPASIGSETRVKPRLSFRFASSYYFMGYICWGIVLARLFGFHWASIVFIVILVLCVSIIYHVDSPPKTLKND